MSFTGQSVFYLFGFQEIQSLHLAVLLNAVFLRFSKKKKHFVNEIDFTASKLQNMPNSTVFMDLIKEITFSSCHKP